MSIYPSVDSFRFISQKKMILDFLSTNPWSNAKKISNFTDVPYGSMHRVLNMMVEMKLIKKTLKSKGLGFVYAINHPDETEIAPLQLNFPQQENVESVHRETASPHMAFVVEGTPTSKSDIAMSALTELAKGGSKEAIAALKEIALSPNN